MAVDNIARGMAAKALENQGGGGSSLPIVNTATVGQTIRVSAVDENGQPTEWEAVDMASGVEVWRKISEGIVADGEVGHITISSDQDGNGFLCKKVLFTFYAPNTVYGALHVDVTYDDETSEAIFRSASTNDQKSNPILGFIDATTPYMVGWIAKTNGYYNQNNLGFLGGARDPRVVSKNIKTITFRSIGGNNYFGTDCAWSVWGVEA